MPTDPANSGSVVTTPGSQPVNLPEAIAEAAWTADAYCKAANQVELGMRGAVGATWLRSQAAICTARQKRFTAVAQAAHGDRQAIRWQRLALGYAESAWLLSTAGMDSTRPTVSALFASKVQLYSAASRTVGPVADERPCVLSRTQRVELVENARQYRTALALTYVEIELLLLHCYARNHNPKLFEVITSALAAFASARATGPTPESFVDALAAMDAVHITADRDPVLTNV